MMPAPLFYQLAADGLVTLHLLFVLFVTCGGVLVLRNRKWALVHLPAVLWAATIEFTGWFCPLTPLENWLRRQGGGTGYPTSFAEHYLLPLLYPTALTRGLQIGLGVAVIGINLLLYFLACRRRRPLPARPGRPGSGADSSGPDTP